MKRDPLVLESSRALNEDGEETSRMENELSDGETPEEAIVNVRDTIIPWMEAAEDVGHAVPPPSLELKLAS